MITILFLEAFIELRPAKYVTDGQQGPLLLPPSPEPVAGLHHTLCTPVSGSHLWLPAVSGADIWRHTCFRAFPISADPTQPHF